MKRSAFLVTFILLLSILTVVFQPVQEAQAYDLGYTTLYSLTFAGEGRILMENVTPINGNGKLLRIYAGFGSDTGVWLTKCALYKDYNYVQTTEEKNGALGTYAFRMYNFSAPYPSLINNTQYMLACWMNTSATWVGGVKYVGTGPVARFYKNLAYTTWPGTITPTITYSAGNFSLYGVYNVEGTSVVSSPSNSSTGVALQPWCAIYANDTDNSTVTVTWQTNATGSWVTQQVNSSFTQGTICRYHYTQANTLSKKYWYRVYIADGVGNNITRWYSFTTRDQYSPAPPSSFTASATSRTNIDISWAKGSYADKTYVEAKLGSVPTSRTDGTNIYNGTGLSVSHTPLNPSEHWYYRSWSWNNTDSVFSSTYSDSDTTTLSNTLPSYGTPSPTNGSTGQPFSLTWSIPITDANGDTFTWHIECSNGQTNTASGASNGTKSLAISGLTYSTLYYIYVNASDIYGTTRAIYHFTARNQYVPDPPSPFTATATDRFIIGLGWTKDSSADKTLVRVKAGTYPTSITDGTFVCNSSGTSAPWSTVPGYHWYFSAWSWNDTDDVYSLTYSIDDAATLSNIPINYGASSPSNNSINQSLAFTWSIPINDTEGDVLVWNISCSNGQYAYNSTGDTNGTKSLILSYLDYSTSYTIYVNSTDGYNWTRLWYVFDTLDNSPVVLSNETPLNTTVGTNISFNWTINITDPNGDIFHYSLECSNGQNFSSVMSSNGTKTLALSGLSYSTLYTVWVNVTDFTDWTREVFTFTTRAPLGFSTPPSVFVAFPVNGTTGVAVPPSHFFTDIIDIDGDLVNITWQAFINGAWETFNTTIGVGNGTYAATNLSWIHINSAWYYWRLLVNDWAGNWTNATYYFVTVAAPVNATSPTHHSTDEASQTRLSSTNSIALVFVIIIVFGTGLFFIVKRRRRK